MSYKVFKGNLARKPEVKQINDTFVMNFDVAEDNEVEHPDGSKSGGPIWHQCSYYSKNQTYLQERAALLEKGMRLLVCGSYYSESYERKDAPTFGVTNRLRVTDFALDLTRVESITMTAPQAVQKSQPQGTVNQPTQPQHNATPVQQSQNEKSVPESIAEQGTDYSNTPI